MENILIFPRSQMAFPDFLLLALTQRKAVCLVNDGNTKGSVFFFALPCFLVAVYPRRGCSVGYPHHCECCLIPLGGESGMVRLIEFQSLFHFPCTVDSELRAQMIGGLPRRRLCLRWKGGTLFCI